MRPSAPDLPPASSALPPLTRTPFRARTDDGVLLCGEWIVPPAPRAVVVTLHAMMVNRRTMDRPAGAGLASTLAEAGLAVANVDLRGHGESDRERPATYDDFVVHDVPAILAAARAAFPGLPVAVVGHSLGGHVTLILAGLLPSRAPDALVLLASNLWRPRTEPSPVRLAQKHAATLVWRAVARALGGFDAPRLRLGTEPAPLAMVEQFSTFFFEDHLLSRDRTLDYDAAIARARLPLLAIASEGDRLLAHPLATRAFADAAVLSPRTHHLVRHGDLGGPAPDHMALVTSPRSRPLWDDIARWILTTLSESLRDARPRTD